MKYEYEIISHNRFEDIKLFIVDLSYRNLHVHREFELCYVLSGRIEVNSFKKQTYFDQGSFILFNPNQPHEIHAVNDSWAKIISLQIVPTFCSRFFPSIGEVEFSEIDICRHMPHECIEELVKLLFSLCNNSFNDEPNNEFLCFSQINLIFHHLINSAPWFYITKEYKANKKNTSNRLNRILDYIESNFKDKIKLDDIAQAEDLSLSYLSHYLKNYLNMSFQDYVTLLRFREAKSLLVRTKMSITDIQMASGFSDYRYLNKIFIEQLGCTPKEFRLNNSIDVYKENSVPSIALQRILTNHESLALLKGEMDEMK